MSDSDYNSNILTEEDVLLDPEASDWLKKAIEELKDKDTERALRDVTILHTLLNMRHNTICQIPSYSKH